METVALLFEASHTNSSSPCRISEWLAFRDNPQFIVRIFNCREFLDGADLNCEHAPRRDMPAFLRCNPMSEGEYDRLRRALLTKGYRLITEPWRAFSDMQFAFRKTFDDGFDRFKIDWINAGASFGSGSYGSLQPTVYICRDDDGFVHDPEGKYLVIGWVRGRRSEEIADEFAAAKGCTFTGEAFFERYTPCATLDGVPIAWRVFYFEGEPIYKGLIDYEAKSYLEKMPKPSDEIVDAFRHVSGNIFYACDFMLLDGGSWKCCRLFDGQMSSVPLGGNDREFAEAFAESASIAPQSPEWVWCLTARVRDENKTGENKRIVHGTRHFAPGTKVFLHPPNWDKRIAAIGIPRYSDSLIRVVMDVRKLTDFALEKVENQEVIVGLQHPYDTWPFTRLARITVGGRAWDNTDESRARIEWCIEWLSSLDPDEPYWA